MSSEEFKGTEINEGPIPGQGVSRKGLHVFTKDKKGLRVVRYKVFNVSDNGDRKRLNTLMTRSYGSLANPDTIGAVTMLWPAEQTHFTKEGAFLTALKYIEVIPVPDDIDVEE